MNDNFIFAPKNSSDYPLYTTACVGNNGNPNILTYAKGFSSAANHLIEICISSMGGEFPADIAVYPICFNMRHAIELYLKGFVSFVDELANIKKIQKKITIDILQAHDINKIWNFLTTNYSILDKRLTNIANSISPYIECFGNIDATGQTFRYPYDTQNNKHLTKQGIINIMHLGKHFKDLEEKLSFFHYFHEILINEYQLGSFTKNLSRYDLSKIAKKLPNINEWKNNSFKIIKDNLKEEYSISSNELSKAIEIIKKHYEFGYSIGIVPPLIDFDEDEFYFFIDKWYQLNDLEYINIELDESKIYSSNSLFKQTKRLTRSAKIGEFLDDLIKTVKLETITNVHTLYYFSEECTYSEQYRLSYSFHKNSCQQNKEQSIKHILQKPMLLIEVIINLLQLNQNKTAIVLMKKYNLEKYIKDQLEKRNMYISIILE